MLRMLNYDHLLCRLVFLVHDIYVAINLILAMYIFLAIDS